jgi:hypothetical protein
MPVEVLDFGNVTPDSGFFGRSRTIAWPVAAYRVTMPTAANRGEGNLNPFERVVIRMLDAGCSPDEKALSEETCIPEDFIRGVLLRLKDKGIIDEHNNLVNRKSLSSEPDYNTAIVYRELVGGKVLPYLHAGQLETRIADANWTLRGSTGCGSRITPKEVMRTANDMRKHTYAQGSNRFIPVQGQITIEDSYERYFIECPIEMWEKDGDFRIVDPFGNGGYSLVLEKVLGTALEKDQSLENWLSKWRLSLTGTHGKSSNKGVAEPFENELCKKRYPELVSALRLRESPPFRTLEKLHAALEWALFYSCMRYDFRDAINILELTPQTEQSPTLEYAAEKKINLEVPPEKFRPLKENGINDFLNKMPDFNTVLAVALIIASDEEAHPLHQIAAKYPNFIARVQSIKRSRDQSGHGKGYASKQDEELPDEPFVRDVVSMLLPDVQFSETGQSVKTDAIIDARFDARTSLLSTFGYGAFNNRICDIAKDRLVNAETYWMSHADGDDALSFAVDVYSAIQAEFSRKLGAGSAIIRESDFIGFATEKAQDTGLGVLPEELRTVKLRWIQAALEGNDQSLGAAAVAFILAAEEESLSAIAELQPDFIVAVAKIIEVRGHGNKPVPLTKTEITELRKTAYSTIKVLVEA